MPRPPAAPSRRAGEIESASERERERGLSAELPPRLKRESLSEARTMRFGPTLHNFWLRPGAGPRRYPCIMKGAEGNHGANVKIVSSLAQLRLKTEVDWGGGEVLPRAHSQPASRFGSSRSQLLVLRVPLGVAAGARDGPRGARLLAARAPRGGARRRLHRVHLRQRGLRPARHLFPLLLLLLPLLLVLLLHRRRLLLLLLILLLLLTAKRSASSTQPPLGCQTG